METIQQQSALRDAENLRNIDRSKYSHARFKTWCGVGQYHIYYRDSASPSGVLRAFTVYATPQNDEILASLRISPLSPTER